MRERSIDSGYRFGRPTYHFDNKVKRNDRKPVYREVRTFSVSRNAQSKNGGLYVRYNGRGMVESLKKEGLKIASVSCSKGVTVWYEDDTVQKADTLTPVLVREVIGFSSEKGGSVYFYIESAPVEKAEGTQAVEPGPKRSERDARREAKAAHRKARLEKKEMKRSLRHGSPIAAK